MSFKCPRCGHDNSGEAKLLLRSGFARCRKCRIGIVWSSSLLSREVNVLDTYVPPGSTISPKTGRVLDSQRVYMLNGFFDAIFQYFGLGSSRVKREGNLKR